MSTCGRSVDSRLDGAYSLVYLNAVGDMLVARDPLGIKPLCYAIEGPLFAAASESVVACEPWFHARERQVAAARPVHHDRRRPVGSATLCPQPSPRPLLLRMGLLRQRCQHDGQPQRLPVAHGSWRKSWPGSRRCRSTKIRSSCRCLIPARPPLTRWPFAWECRSREGLIRNRYAGRTFIEGSGDRKQKAESKYTPLREVLEDKRVLLVEDSIVRSTTMKVLLHRIRSLGHAREIHVRVACPPIIAPCFYGIDMSTISELFAPHFLENGVLTEASQTRMANQLGADSLRYLPGESIARAILRRFDSQRQLCQACLNGTIRRVAARSFIRSLWPTPRRTSPRGPTKAPRSSAASLLTCSSVSTVRRTQSSLRTWRWCATERLTIARLSALCPEIPAPLVSAAQVAAELLAARTSKTATAPFPSRS